MGFALFERSEFAKPRQHRGAQGIPPLAGQGTQGAFSFGSFPLGKQRNEQKNKGVLLLPKVLGNQK